MPEEGKDPRGESEGQDTDEQFQDHPELAPPEGRVSRERVKGLEEEAHKRSLTQDPVEDAGDRHHKTELRFVRNNDFAGNEAELPTDADYSRGSGFIGGKLVGEGPSGEKHDPAETWEEGEGFQSSVDQERNLGAIQDEEAGQPDWSAHPIDPETEETQGRDFHRPEQTTAMQAFGRDMGSSGLDQEIRDGHAVGQSQPPISPEQKLWATVLRRLGGGSPGSDENLQLAEIFSKVQFPADPESVLHKLKPGAELRLKEGIEVDLKDAIEHSRTKLYRNLGELVDAVKDELRRIEKAGLVHLKTA